MKQRFFLIFILKSKVEMIKYSQRKPVTIVIIAIVLFSFFYASLLYYILLLYDGKGNTVAGVFSIFFYSLAQLF